VTLCLMIVIVTVFFEAVRFNFFIIEYKQKFVFKHFQINFCVIVP
jgi:hypothetical protein